MVVNDKVALKITINTCKGYLDTIQEFCNRGNYGLADITRNQLLEELEELECILETIQ